MRRARCTRVVTEIKWRVHLFRYRWRELELLEYRVHSQVDSSFGLAFNLRFVWPPTCVDLHRLAWTCVDFGRAQIWTQVDASFLPFGHPAQVDTSWSQVICCYKNALTNDMREIYGFLRLANPFGHPSQVRTQVLVLQTCVDLRRLASPFGQGFKLAERESNRCPCRRRSINKTVTIMRSS